LKQRYIHTIWPTHCVIGDGEYGIEGRWLDISGRDINFTEVNASRGHELTYRLHLAIETWKDHWRSVGVTKAVKTIDTGEELSKN
jgi:hypothetical protein